jgi:hypothetical protein
MIRVGRPSSHTLPPPSGGSSRRTILPPSARPSPPLSRRLPSANHVTTIDGVIMRASRTVGLTVFPTVVPTVSATVRAATLANCVPTKEVDASRLGEGSSCW